MTRWTLIICLAICAGAAPAQTLPTIAPPEGETATEGDAATQSGRFPVFGPSAEREEFFQSQQDAAAERAEAIRKERAEAELARDLAEIEAEAEAERTTPRRIVIGGDYRGDFRRCYYQPKSRHVVWIPEGTDPSVVVQNAHVRGEVRPLYVPCPPYLIDKPYSRTDIRIGIDDGNVTAEGTIRRPGLKLRFDID